MKAEKLLRLGIACQGDFNLLRRCLEETQAKLVVVVGSGLGVLSAVVMEYSDALLLSVDIDPDNRELQNLESVGLLDKSRILQVIMDSALLGRELSFFGRDDVMEPGHEKVPFDLIVVDGGHEKEQVTADIAAWVPHLRSGGYLFFHDYEATTAPLQHPGVKEAVDESEVVTWPIVGRAGWSIAFRKP